ncbi:class I SAM-dependent methyltransferase [Methanohalobium sp.]|uniref:class I SAM-dependent methyltransferase n=1 Tax=Methanohalobium sp. TaxID=2837493 RepID=UPI0025D3F377|nr:class I SAM-dependent methyltransferase [Methanohalobium sp.]
MMYSEVCPWWLYFALDNRIRKSIHKPEQILDNYVELGQKVMDFGCGPGTYTIDMAQMVGRNGKVIAVDFQEKMLKILEKKCKKEGLESRVKIHQNKPESIGISEKVDFVLAFYVIHELPAIDNFFTELRTIVKPEGNLLVIEPKLHVRKRFFDRIVYSARNHGFVPQSRINIRFSHAVLFKNVTNK